MGQITRRLAFYDLRDWWLSDKRIKELIVEPRPSTTPGGWDISNPFFPVAQQPEGGFPYIRYTVARETGTSQWWMHTEQVGIDLYTDNILDSTEVLNRFISMAGREDDSAKDLHRWLELEGRTPEFEYHSIRYIGGGDIGASSEEGGAHSRIMMFSIDYSPLVGHGLRA